MAADLFLSNCSTEGDLAQLAQALLNEAALIRDTIVKDINNLSFSDATLKLDKLNEALDNLIKGDGDEFSKQVGLLPKKPSILEQEERLEALGLVLINKILYAMGTNSNIEEFRKLYFAVGSNTPLFLSLLRSAEPLIVVQTHLTVKRLPVHETWTLAKARKALDNSAIEAIYTTTDGVYTIVPTFLGVNKSVKQAALEHKVPESEVVTQVFWLKSVQKTSDKVNKLTNYGLTNAEISSVLTETPLKTLNSSELETLRAIFDASVRKTLDQMQLLNQRFGQIEAPARETLRKEILLSLDASKSIILKLQKTVRFSPTVIQRPEDIEAFLELNSQDDIKYLLSEKRSVVSISFEESRESLSKKIRTASSLPAGSNTVSSVFNNRNLITLDEDINSTNEALALNHCGVNNLSKIGKLIWTDLEKSHTCIAATKIRPLAVLAKKVPVIGYEGMDSAASTIFLRANIAKSLKADSLLEEIKAAIAKLNAEVAAAVAVFIEMLNKLTAAIDGTLNPLIAALSETMVNAESALSRLNSYIGVDPESSVLMCKIPKIAATFPFLEMAALISQLKASLKGLLTSVAAITADVLNNLACMPVNFLNDTLKNLRQDLPSLCRVGIDLPTELESSFNQLRGVYESRNFNLSNFITNVKKIKADLELTSSKLDSFQENLSCRKQEKNERFLDSFKNSVQSTDAGGVISSLLPVRG